MVKNVKKINKCRICGSTDLYDVIELGEQPIPNGFLRKEDLKKEEKKYPLSVCFCTDCTLMQLKYLVNAKVMFKNYLYIPSSSKTRIDHFKSLAAEVSDVAKLDNNSLVIDVGSNDGSLLVVFKNMGANVLGIDPAENLATVAELNGVPTVVGYFDSIVAKKVVKKHGKAKIMLATNVFAHIADLHEVMKGADILLEDNGIFVTQFPYLTDLLEKNLFDTIYHEHLSYFSVKSLLYLAQVTGLEIFDIQRNDLDGGSIRVFWKKKSNNTNKINNEQIEKLVNEEEKFGIEKKETYDKFRVRVERLKKKTVEKLKNLRKKNKRIVGYGAAAKANVTLNYFNLGKSTIDYLVDSTPYKQGLYTPGSHIPIFSEDKIYETDPDYLLIFAWNFSKEIMEKNRKFKNSGGKFIILEPKLTIF